MAERFQKIPGTQKISESYGVIDQNFEQLDNELSAIEQRIESLDTLSPADRAKLDGIEEGAQVNQNAYAKVNGMEADNPSDEVTIEGGTGITVTTNPNTKEVIITATGEATPGPHGSSHLEHGSDPIPYATTTEGGLMSAEDKQSLVELNQLSQTVTSHLAETIQQENDPHGVYSEFRDRSVNVKWFGAVGDGVTDDTQALQDAIASLEGNAGEIIVPEGSYLYNETLILGNGQILRGVGYGLGSINGTTLLYSGAGSAVEIKRNGCLKQVRVRKKHNGWDGWNLANPVSGVKMTDSFGRVEDIFISDFEVGLHMIGENQGCAYNQAFLRQVFNCLVGIKLDATGTGWVNENIVYGGGISIESTRQTGSEWENESWGIYMDSNSAHIPNNNKFFGVSIEGMNHGIRVVGVYNSFYGPRIEIPGTLKLLFQNVSAGMASYNWIFGVYGIYTFGTHVLNKAANGDNVPYLNNNMIFCRGSNIPLEVFNGGGISFFPSYRGATMKYDVDDNTFIMSITGAEVARIGRNTHDFKRIQVKGFVSERGTSRPSPASAGQLFFDTNLGKPIWYDGTKWVDAMGNTV